MKNLKKNEQGLAAIVVTLFILIVLSLVVLAFSQIARREQRQSLDRQLSSQAFYAAESGINTASKYIRSTPVPPSPLEKVRCEDPPALAPNLDTGGNFQYSCVLFDRAPRTIEYSSVDTSSGEFVSLKTLGNDLTTLTITWSDTDGGDDFTGCAAAATDPFPEQSVYEGTAANRCDAGMIRILLMPFSAGSNRQALTNASYTVYLRPVKPSLLSALIPAFFQRHEDGGNSQGNVVAAKCNPPGPAILSSIPPLPDNTPGKCSASITTSPASLGITLVPPGTGLYMHIKSIYKDSLVSIAGFNLITPVRFTEAQAKIDSTGKVADVLKRLQVRIPLVEKQQIPTYVLESMTGICKQLNVYPPNGANPGFANNAACGGLN